MGDVRCRWCGAPEPKPAVGSGPELLDTPLLQAFRDTKASVGLLYLLPKNEQTLRLAVTTDVPSKVAALWERLLVTDAGPVADAVRERRLVWLADQTEMAHRYPRAALMLPYPVALAAAPLMSGSRVWGGLVLLWPASRLPRLSTAERSAIRTACAQMGSLLQQADADRQPILPAELPHTAAPPLADAAGLSAADLDAAALEGWCALDPAGRVTFISTHAANLLGSSVPDLLGALPDGASMATGISAFPCPLRAARCRCA